MFEEIIQIIGKKEGPTSIILAGVHGNEKCGVEALRKTLSNLKIERGRVFFGYGNPRAIENNQRFTEANLNRMFKEDNLLSENDKKSYEYKRAQFLKNYLDKADALLDIHASSTPNSKPFIVCEVNAKKIVEFLPIDLVVSGFDKLESGGTDYYMNNKGKIGICLECGYKEDPQSTKVAEENIFAFLKTRGHIANNLRFKKQSYVKMYDLYKTETNKFTIEKSFDDFEEIQKGQVIGIDGDQKIKSKKKAIILFARNREKTNEEAFLLGEKKDSLA